MNLSKEHTLDGLEPDNLLAFLALLGFLRALETASPIWKPRVKWSLDSPPLRPVLVLDEEQAQDAICDKAAEGVDMLTREYYFPSSTKDEKPQRDLNYEGDIAREILEKAARDKDRESADIFSSLMSDAAIKEDGKIDATSLCLLFGQGHQHFLDRLATIAKNESLPARGRGKKAVAVSLSKVLREALFYPWERRDPTFSFRWDPAEDVRYALRSDDPSSSKSTTQHGANVLAVVSLPMLTVVPVQIGEKVRLRGVGGESKRAQGYRFAWPIWKGAIDLATVRVLLSHPNLIKQPQRLKYLGVEDVRYARRISVGKFMNFTWAEVLSQTD